MSDKELLAELIGPPETEDKPLFQEPTNSKQVIKHYERYISWIDGAPVPATREILRKEVFEVLPTTVLSLPYEPTPSDIELGQQDRFTGMTNGEVMLLRIAEQAAGGDQDAAKMLLDRILGKPRQHVEVKKLTMTYQDFLEQVATNEKTITEKVPNEFDL